MKQKAEKMKKILVNQKKMSIFARVTINMD